MKEDIKNKFIKFYKSKNFIHYNADKLVPSVEDTTLFTIAGMKQFSDYFLRTKTPNDKLIITSQPCIRLNDLNLIGKTKRHLTLFEMFGFFSFGGIKIEEAISFLYESIKEVLGNNIFKYCYITVYDTDILTFNIWKKLLESNGEYIEGKIIKVDSNFWYSGETGPCGPCTEVLLDTFLYKENKEFFISNNVLEDSERFLELANLVLVEFNKIGENKLDKFNEIYFDMGLGLERFEAVLEKTFDVFKTKTFQDIIKFIEAEPLNQKIIADHLRTIIALIEENIFPSNKGRGYVLRKLIRKSFFFYKNILDVLKQITENMHIIEVVENEIKLFNKILEKGLKIIEETNNITPEFISVLHHTHGFPSYISKEKLNLSDDFMDKVEKLLLVKTESFFQEKFITKNLCYENYYKVNGQVIGLYNKEKKLVNFLENENGFLVSDITCFYGKSGGQQGDSGFIRNDSFSAEVIEAIKYDINQNDSFIIHEINNVKGKISLNEKIILEYNKELREGKKRAHTGIHLLHAAFLLEDKNMNYAGSNVESDKIRLDLYVNKKKDFDLEKIQQTINRWIYRGFNVNVSLESKRENDAIQIEGISYNDLVRVITIKDEKNQIISKECCCGTHVNNTKEIIQLEIKNFIWKGSNVLRIEAITNPTNFIENIYRNYRIIDLKDKINIKVKISGWVENIRDLKENTFLIVKDETESVQCLIESYKFPKIHIGSFITIEGLLQERPIQTYNNKIFIGNKEIIVKNIKVISSSDLLPFPLNSIDLINDDQKLEYRFLYLKEKQSLFKKFHLIESKIREIMNRLGFTHIKTPEMTASTPEGARDFLVPSSVYPGLVYALAQSPQMYKQMLGMFGLFYYQIASCFRDEGLRLFRQLIHRQLDVEMFLVCLRDLINIEKKVIEELFLYFSDKPIKFTEMTYKEAMETYGTDKPNLNNPLFLEDFTKYFKNSDFKIFNSLINNKNFIVKGIRLPKNNLDIEEVENFAKKNGFDVSFYRKDKGIFQKFFVGEEDVVFICDKKPDVLKNSNIILNFLGEKLNLIKDMWSFCFVLDFPMFETDENTGKIDFCHNPFSMPNDDGTAQQFDLVCNGIELSSGAIRNHNYQSLIDGFLKCGYKEDYIKKNFKGILNAMKYGPAPHGGFGLGLERVLMLLENQKSITQVIPFPFSSGCKDLLMGAPNKGDENQLVELGIKFIKKN